MRQNLMGEGKKKHLKKALNLYLEKLIKATKNTLDKVLKKLMRATKQIKIHLFKRKVNEGDEKNKQERIDG